MSAPYTPDERTLAFFSDFQKMASSHDIVTPEVDDSWSVLHGGGIDSLALLDLLSKSGFKPRTKFVRWLEDSAEESLKSAARHAETLGCEFLVVDAGYLDTIYSPEFIDYCRDYRFSNVSRAALAFVSGGKCMLGGFPVIEKNRSACSSSEWWLKVANHDFANDDVILNFGQFHPSFAKSVVSSTTASLVVNGALPGKLSLKSSREWIYADLGIDVSGYCLQMAPELFMWDAMNVRYKLEREIERRQIWTMAL